MLVGYARTSTVEQAAGLEAQVRDLQSVGVRRVFQEQTSSVGPRPQLEALLEFVREGDTVVITKLDRLARSVRDLMTLIDTLSAKGAALRILAMSIDTSTPTGKLMLTILGGVAEFERELMLERQREGIRKAQAAGCYKGRAPTARAKRSEIAAMLAEGAGPTAIAARLGIARSSVYRRLKEQRG